jgi:hypothetical protein
MIDLYDSQMDKELAVWVEANVIPVAKRLAGENIG